MAIAVKKKKNLMKSAKEQNSIALDNIPYAIIITQYYIPYDVDYDDDIILKE